MKSHYVSLPMSWHVRTISVFNGTRPQRSARTDVTSHLDQSEQSANIRRMVMLAMDTDPGHCGQVVAT